MQSMKSGIPATLPSLLPWHALDLAQIGKGLGVNSDLLSRPFGLALSTIFVISGMPSDRLKRGSVRRSEQQCAPAPVRYRGECATEKQMRSCARSLPTKCSMNSYAIVPLSGEFHFLVAEMVGNRFLPRFRLNWNRSPDGSSSFMTCTALSGVPTTIGVSARCDRSTRPASARPS